jgi:serine/threonine kinase PknH
VDGTPFGRYRLIELLGRGGMGEVWRAFDTETDRTVAIKLLPRHLSEDEEFQRRFRREAHAAARLNNPHVIPIHNYGEIDGQLYVDMRLIDGRDLHTVLADGPLDPARAVRIIDQVASALHAAHQIGLLHRDIKPSNVLLDGDDFAYLIDFGIARALDETRMTKSGNTFGTFAYIAPERLGNGTDEDARADIYSLACVLYECLTGSPPFTGDTMARLVTAHLNTPPPRPSITQPEVPSPVDEVIARGMAKDPEQRYATTIELAEAARDAITEPIQRPTPSPAPHRPPTEPAPSPPTEPAQPPWATAPTQRRTGPQPVSDPEPSRSSAATTTGGGPGKDAASTRRLIIIGGTAAAVIVAIGVAVMFVAQSSGPKTTPASTTAAAPAAPAPVAPGRLASVVLGAPQVSTIMGTSSMLIADQTQRIRPDLQLSNPDCLGAFDAIQDGVYAGSGFTGVYGQELNAGDNAYRIYEAAVSFPTADKAQAFVAAQADKWKACNGLAVTLTAPRALGHWTFGSLTGAAPKVTQVRTREDGASTCQRVLSAVSDIVLDVRACAPGILDQGGQIADAMAANVK